MTAPTRQVRNIFSLVAGVRRKGSQQAGPDIRAALDANNYLLANQLLLGILVVSREEQQAASHTDGVNPTPRAAPA